MGWWSYESSAEVQASLPDAWHYFSDLEGVIEWNENLVSHEVVKGPPNEVGSIVILHYKHGKQETSTTVTTLEREEQRRIVQNYVSGDTESVGTAVFESVDFDTTRISMSIRFDMQNVSFWSRPVRKALVKVMAKDMLGRFSTFLAGDQAAKLESILEEDAQ
jgi:uncharacterized membrane protein